MADEMVSHGFHPRHSERLAAYWAEALGGPPTYSERYGDETTVVRLHSGNGPHEEMDEAQSSASTKPWKTPASPTSGCGRSCTCITQAHDGTLTLTPRDEGGLRVTVQLPAAPNA